MSKQFDFSPKLFGELKNKMCTEKTQEAMEKFYDVFALMVKDGAWVNAPVNDMNLVVSEFRGGEYLAIYSCLDNRVKGDSKDIMAIDINKFIDVLYENPSLLGIVVDPNKEPFLINRRAIHELTVHLSVWTAKTCLNILIIVFLLKFVYRKQSIENYCVLSNILA